MIPAYALRLPSVDVPEPLKQAWKRSVAREPWLIALLVMFGLLAFGSWGKIEHPLLDVGHEVEIPARLLTGELLYRDVATYYGPVAYYINAVLLLLLGSRLEVFYATGLTLSLVATLLFYRLARLLMETSWAALSALYFLVYCAMGPHIFNFVMPYSYGSVYALIFCFVSVLCLDRNVRRRRSAWLISGGVFCGLAVLSKQEYGVAITAALLFAAAFGSSQTIRERLYRCSLVLLPTAAVVFFLLALVARKTGWNELMSSLLPVLKSDVLARSGLLEVSPVKTIRAWSSGFRVFLSVSLAVFVSLVIASRLSRVHFLFRFNPWARSAVAIAIGLLCFLSGVALLERLVLNNLVDYPSMIQPLKDLSWSLPLMVAAMLFRLSRASFSRGWLLLWTLLVFAVLLNARWLFHATFYGLYAPPLVLLFFALAYKLTERTRIPLWSFLLLFLLLGCVQKSFPVNLAAGGIRGYRYAVCSPHGTFRTKDSALAQVFNQTIDVIRDSGAVSVLVLPEGSLLNFLTGTHAPGRETTFIPGILPDAKSELTFINLMRTHPPDLIVHIDVPFVFLKKGYRFLSDYNPLVHDWIVKEHELIRTFPILSGFAWHRGVVRIYGPLSESPRTIRCDSSPVSPP